MIWIIIIIIVIYNSLESTRNISSSEAPDSGHFHREEVYVVFGKVITQQWLIYG